ncbi:MAG TPA: T9SS type B sorting domain-containing protein [Ohtaekwangia sp.]|nr:T9SS type B sorting domain-containing protein [Ohtaekwangia sp.]
MKPLILLILLTSSVMAEAQRPHPTIVGQSELDTNEEEPITIRLSHLRVYDRDDFFYPWGFTLTIYPGENYNYDGFTVTPATDFTGILSVNVSVNDGRHESDVYGLKITVNPVNDAPVITSQSEIQTIENKSLALSLAQLSVTDADDNYPDGFTLIVNSGTNYVVNGTTITPAPNFVGNLNVSVMVNDGTVNSNVYTLKVVVISANKTPVITGQTALTTPRNTPLTIGLTHLTVSDPDSDYPDDFKLSIYNGKNYSVSNDQIIPANNYAGILTVPVAVNDRHTTSATFNLKVTVTDELQITGQEVAAIAEEESFKITLNHLHVYDPNNQYPKDFRLRILDGEDYTYDGAKVIPSKNYSGTLGVVVTISNGDDTSDPFTFIITVTPVNDPPEIENFITQAIRYNPNTGPINVLKEPIVIDIDDKVLTVAEIAIQPDGYERGFEDLTVDAENIQATFDMQTGILTLNGNASLSEYATVLNTIQYEYNYMEGVEPNKTKTLSFKLFDGKDHSETYERKINMTEAVDLDIPTAFTPNNDMANDTWNIKLLKPSDRFNDTIIRVFSRKGMLVYESKGFDKPWDGRYNGEFLPPDTYFYTIDFNLTSSTDNLRGVVTILR